MRHGCSRSDLLRVAGLLLLFFGIILTIHFIVETWNWTDRLSVIGVWDKGEISETYGHMQSSIVTDLALTTTSLLLLCIPSYADNLKRKPWKISDFRKVLALTVLTGGTIYANPASNKFCVRYYGKSVVLHKVFCAMVQRVYNLVAIPARWTTHGSFMTQIYRKEIVEDLLTLSPTYSTRNGHHSHQKHVYPTAGFLTDVPLNVLQEAVRIGASTNGCIRYAIEPILGSNGRYHVRPHFTFGYLSPESLLNDYQTALSRLGIRVAQVMDKRYGRGFLLGRSWDTLATLSSMGGFIDGVRVNRGRHKGLNLNDVLLGLLKFQKKEDNNFVAREEALQTVEQYMEKYRSAIGRSSEGSDMKFSTYLSDSENACWKICL